MWVAWGEAMIDLVQDATLIRNVTKKVYRNSRYFQLRTQISEEDLIQMVFLKLLSRDNYKRYSEEYSLIGFLYRVANGCAINASKKNSVQREITLLDAPIDSEDNSTLSDMVTDSCRIYECSDSTDEDMLNMMDIQANIDLIRQYMPNEESSNVIIRKDDVDTPFTLRAMFDLFIEGKMSKEEIHKYIININSGKPVIKLTFRKMWNRMLKSARNTLTFV